MAYAGSALRSVEMALGSAGAVLSSAEAPELCCTMVGVEGCGEVGGVC